VSGSPGTARARLYAGAVARVLVRAHARSGSDLGAVTDRPVFVVGAPRSGTSFVARSIGRLPGFVDLGELKPWKASIPQLAALPEEEAAKELRRALEAIRRYGLVRRLRAVEQSPETAFVLGPIVRAYPQAAVVHMLRDPRDVAASLLQKGWLRAGRPGQDDVGSPYGHHVRFWVEPERAEEFDRAGEARRPALLPETPSRFATRTSQPTPSPPRSRSRCTSAPTRSSWARRSRTCMPSRSAGGGAT